MKALSIKQPWAYLIASGIKDIENRTWKTNFRGRIYIHASAKMANFWLTPQSSIVEKEINKIIINDYESTTGLFSAIIGEVDIIDCVINHPSIWAEQSLTKPEIEDYRNEVGGNMELYKHNLELWKNSKPIYNWVLANPVLYDKPILNVKGKLSFWEWHGCEQTCESCEKYFDIDNMQRDGADNYFCKECADELFPIMQQEYEEMVANGEIDPDDN